MLKQLHIQNLAIIEELELEFNKGMTVLTGETGAGKSILIDAIGLILGDRGDSSMVRDRNNKSEIVATFDISCIDEIQSVLDEQSIDNDGDEMVVRRVINRDGRSKAYINSSQIPIQLLKSIGEFLVDIHGQHAHQSLMKRTVQRSLLDHFANHMSLLNDVNNAYQVWKSIIVELEQIGTDSNTHESTIELLRYQVKELEDLSMDEGEYKTLEEEYKRLFNVNQLITVTHSVLEMLSENEVSVDTVLNRAIYDLKGLQKSDMSTEKFVDLLDGVSIQLTDTIDEIRNYSETLEINPERLNEVDNRLNAMHDMARKHNIQAQELPDHLLQLQEKLQQLTNNQDSVEKLNEQQTLAKNKYFQSAGKLNKSRQKAALAMAKEITKQLKQLGMSDGKFIVEISSTEPEQPLRDGLDQIEYLVSLNPGFSPQPLRKVASGGELSRISLAIQMISKDANLTPTLIFDEVDAGIGGGTAETVGILLKDLAAKHQVFCVTHLPQVASQGTNHIQVNKYSKDNTTYTNVTMLDNTARVEEIARMLGGIRISKKTREHARELLGQEMNAI